MSGTSMDGVDVALLDRRAEGAWRLAAFATTAYSEGRRRRLLDAISAGSAESLTGLHADLGEWFAEAVLGLLARADVDPGDIEAIGSHGQTVWHRPPRSDRRGATLQLGDPATLAARTGIGVVSDFRTADMAAGGQGAPLVPWPDRELFSVEGRTRVVLNVGGMANLTWLAPRGAEAAPVAFDTGPGNVLIDAAAERVSEGGERCDRDGIRAARGTVDRELLAALRAHAFYDRPPPRSTGREEFGAPLVDALVRERGIAADSSAGDDLIATLTALTAVTVAEAMARWVRPRPIDEVVVAGGGVHNPTLMAWLREALGAEGIDAPLRTDARALGMDPDAREAAGFAVLAWAHRDGLPGNLPSVTGASGPRVLGSWTPAPPTGAGP
ncbi:MAG: anhydro-N-acetylmuramic acid kinase [Gemmatimonadetes bacterium]|nr:anhydro-N-acetylmuramic acid kinase [Gemmatimonadota bacterium]